MKTQEKAAWEALLLPPLKRWWFRRRQWKRDPLDIYYWGLNRDGEWSWGGSTGNLPRTPARPCRNFRLFADEIARERLRAA